MIEQQQSYRFKLDNPHLNQSLIKVDFKVKIENCQANFQFIENVNGSTFNLIENLINRHTIELVVLDEKANDSYKISLYDVKISESEIQFSYDYTSNKPLTYNASVKFRSLFHRTL